MKRLMSKMACAALGLSLCFGASASPRIPVAMAPMSQSASLKPTLVSSRVVIIIVIVTRPVYQELEHADQGQFDRTN